MKELLLVISEELYKLNIDYDYMIFKTTPLPYPYVVGEYYENGYSYESNMSEGEFLLTLWDRNKSNERLINLNETIKEHFADFRVIKNNVAMSISYSSSLPIEEDNDDLKKQELRLDIKYVKGE